MTIQPWLGHNWDLIKNLEPINLIMRVTRIVELFAMFGFSEKYLDVTNHNQFPELNILIL